jgi:hypothetical protein
LRTFLISGGTLLPATTNEHYGVGTQRGKNELKH